MPKQINMLMNEYVYEKKNIYILIRKERFSFFIYLNDFVQKTMAHKIFPQTPRVTNVAT